MENPTSSNYFIRQGESSDADELTNGFEIDTTIFGFRRPITIIENSLTTLALCSANNKLVAFAAIDDFPSNLSKRFTMRSNWKSIITSDLRVNCWNSLHLVFFVLRDESYEKDRKRILNLIAASLLHALPEMDNLLMTLPLSAQTVKCVPFQLLTQSETIKILSIQRKDVLPRLKIRRAKIQDTDDLTPLFNRHTETLRMAYGDYFLAETISQQDNGSSCYVADVDGVAMGFVGLTTDLNVELLTNTFEIAPFDYFKMGTIRRSICPSQTSDVGGNAEVKIAEVQTNASGLSRQASHEEGTMLDLISMSQTAKTSQNMLPNLSNLDMVESVALAPIQSREPSVDNLMSNSALPSTESSVVPSTAPSEIVGDNTEDIIHDKDNPIIDKESTKEEMYANGVNGVVINMFVIDEKYEHRSVDFLGAIFEKYEDYDYAIISIPHTVPEFPLIRNFIRTTPLPNQILDQELYVFHRLSLMYENFRCAQITYDDMENISAFVRRELHNWEAVEYDLKHYLTFHQHAGFKLHAYAFYLGSYVIGICLLRTGDVEQLEFIRSNYNLDDFIYYETYDRAAEHAIILYFIIAPSLNNMSKMFLQQMMQMSNISCLYLCVNRRTNNKSVYIDTQPITENETEISEMQFVPHTKFKPQISQQSLFAIKMVNCLPSMVALHERIHEVPSVTTEKIDRDELLHENFTVFHLNKKLLLERKLVINIRIVCVGASDTILTLIRKLVFTAHLRFNNLILISRNGIEISTDSIVHKILGSRRYLTDRMMERMSLASAINVIEGIVTIIDRKRKQVIVNDKSIVPYDHLILGTGIQYEVDYPSTLALDRLPRSTYRQKISNYFCLNDMKAIESLIYFIQQRTMSVIDDETQESSSFTKIFLIYGFGYNLDVVSCIQCLIDMGIPGKQIVWVIPKINTNLPFNEIFEQQHFPCEMVENEIFDYLEKHGVKVLGQFMFYEWNGGYWRDGDTIRTVKVYGQNDTAEAGTINVGELPNIHQFDVEAIISFSKMMPDYHLFRAVNEAALVYDGRLVIDSEFHTNDPSIRAAGPLTKYGRTYHDNYNTHASYNPVEVGEHIANCMLRLFDPNLTSYEDDKSKEKLLPDYKQPVYYQTLICDSRYVFSMRPAAWHLERNRAKNSNDRTYLTNKNGEYFSIICSRFNKIKQIICVSNKPIKWQSYIKLYGLHVRLLNNLATRFNDGLIDDFFQFFTEPWATVFYYDRFDQLRLTIRNIMKSEIEEETSAENYVRNLIDDDLQISPNYISKMKELMKTKGLTEEMTKQTLNYLKNHATHLSDYAT
ncbi:hypothetical protein SNEBB_011095 [Seison nebaliae]|nr:hypothetical protein SNEBB_011095 [Seison nebaliae]